MGWNRNDIGKFGKESYEHQRKTDEQEVIKDELEIYYKPFKKKSIPNYKKKFGIEYRYSYSKITNFKFMKRFIEWSVYKWYMTEKQREEAFKRLQKNSNFWEYRVINR